MAGVDPCIIALVPRLFAKCVCEGVEGVELVCQLIVDAALTVAVSLAMIFLCGRSHLCRLGARLCGSFFFRCRCNGT